MNKLQRIEEMEKQLAALKAEVERESKQWEPKGGKWYYTTIGTGSASSVEEYASAGVERQTREQAEADYKLSRAYNRLLAYRAEFDADFVPDWGNDNWDKCYLFKQRGEWVVGTVKTQSHLSVVYFSKRAANDLCDKLNSGEVVL